MVLTRNKSALKKVDDELQIVWGEVYAPGVPDSQGDFMRADEIRAMAYDFMLAGNLLKVDVNHDNQLYGCCIVESFIARDEDPDFIPGSWVVAVHVPSPELWAMVKSGELNGFSLEGIGLRKETTLEMEIPPELSGETDLVQGHTHRFTVYFDPDGTFKGGKTDAGPDGHTHLVVRGTVTEEAGGHTHRFSFVEGLLDA